MSFACERVLERLSPFLDRELPEVEIGEIREHLAFCPPCDGAHRRLARLEAMSISILRRAPAVAEAEWTARWSRAFGAGGQSAKVISLRDRRERSIRRTAGRFALAAALLVAATLTVPFLHGSLHPPVEHPNHLCYNRAPGANEGEIVEEPWTDSTDHGVWVDSGGDSEDGPVVITISKL
jgi:hypothetical protein